MELQEGKKIILFDGTCNLCNGAINFVIRHDSKDVFRYTSLQGVTGKNFLAERHIDTDQTDSIVLIDPGMAYYLKSDAALAIAGELGWPWKILTIFQYILPGVFRDKIYDWIAANRYKWFGKREKCMIPSPSLRAKFLDV